jgi:hypothetical protein
MQTLLNSASDPAVMVTGGGALPPTIFDELLAYLLNHLNDHLPPFYKSPEFVALAQPKKEMVGAGHSA